MSYADPVVQREYQRQWNAKRRAHFFSDKTCPCGAVKNLELHHRDRSSKVSHCIWSWSKPRREAEIAKCDVLCRACHRRETVKQFNFNSPKHGTEHCYRKHRCRCALCSMAHAFELKFYRPRAKKAPIGAKMVQEIH